MAAIVKTTSTLNINFLDSTGAITTWKINDPVSGVTLTQINNNVFEVMKASNHPIFCNSAGYDLIAVKSAEYETITKSTEQITA